MKEGGRDCITHNHDTQITHDSQYDDGDHDDNAEKSTHLRAKGYYDCKLSCIVKVRNNSLRYFVTQVN